MTGMTGMEALNAICTECQQDKGKIQVACPWRSISGDYCEEYETIKRCIDRLAELEDKIEDGTLVELPCKVKQDKDSFFYYTEPLDEIDKKFGLKPKKIYLAFVQTVCEDFKETYCYGENTKEFYDRHFTDVDDTIEIKLIKAEKKLKKLKGEKE